MRAMKKSERKLAMREQAKRRVRVNPAKRSAIRAYRDDVEKGRRELLRVSAEGGDSQAKKARGELMYLINNYLPSYDARIEQLIDVWRRSGDPGYDTGIREKYRRARRKHMTQGSL